MPEAHGGSGTIVSLVIPKGTPIHSVDPEWRRNGRATPRKRAVRAHPFKLSDKVVYWETGSDLRFCNLSDVRFPERAIAAVANGQITA